MIVTIPPIEINRARKPGGERNCRIVGDKENATVKNATDSAERA
jgi:hypothetical protein